MNELQTLFDVLVREGKYTKSFDEFYLQMQGEDYQNKVFGTISRDGLYTKDINSFKQKYLGKAKDSTVDPTMSQDDMGSELDDGSSESVSWFDQTWFGRGIAAASTTGEATDLMAQDFSNVSMESIQEFMKAKEQESKSHVPSERMNKFQKKYKEEGSTWSAFFRGVKDQPGLLPELFVQSLGTQVGTLIDSPGASLAAAGTGAAGGAMVGAVPGAVAGFMGGLATSMEAALTFGELIETELKGKEFTDENIKELLEGPKGNSIRNKSIGRGLTIGAIEGLSGGIAGKAAIATKGAVKGVRKATLAAGAAGVGVEAVGGATGEVLGRAVAGQEMDAAEIGFEAITGTVTAPLNVSAALLTAKKPTYKLNGSSVTYEQMKDFVDTADPMDIARANIQMKDDYTGIGNKAKAKQEAVREGIKLSGDEATIAEVDKAKRDNQISDTIAFAETQGKRIGKQTIVVDNNEQAQATHDKIAEEMGLKAQDVTNADGFIIGDSIIINKDIAGRTGAINVGAHEVLHGVLAKHMQGLIKDIKDKDGNVIGQDKSEVKKLISSFKNVLSKKQLTAVTTRLQDNYKDQIAADPEFMETTEEWFTAFSDAIEQNEIAFDEGVFGKIKNTIQEILRKFGIKKDFADGRQAYNFLKDYSKSIKNNKLSSRAMALAGEGATVTDVKKSVSPLEAINNLIPKNIKTKKEFDTFVKDRRLFPPVFIATMDNGVISNYVKSKSIGDEYRGAIESVQNRITNFDPEATRADGSIVGPEGFGEFIFANTRFGKLDSKKALAIKAEKRKQEVRGDQVTETGKTVFEGLVSEEPSKKKKAEPKGQKRREIQSLSNVYGVANEIGLNNKIQALIEQNPKNLEAAIKDLIQKDVRKTIAKQMGKISKIQGEVVVSDEYKAFLGFNYKNIVKGLDVATIKKNYNQLFELTEIGKEDRRTRKSDKPSLKKDSNYRKGIFKIETNKAKFTKFFTEGGYTTLLDRQKKLAILISESIVEDVVNDQIIENSNDIDTVIQAEVRNYLNKLNRQKKEVRGNYADQIKFSKSVKDFAAEIKQIENPTFIEVKSLYTTRYADKIDEEILDDIEKIFDRLGPQITVNEFREAAGEAVITKGKGINFTFYDSVKEFLAKAFPKGNVKALDLMTESGETTFMSGLKGLTALMDPRVLNLSLITNTFLAGNSLYTFSSGTRVNSKGKTVPKSISKNEIPSKYNDKGKQDFEGNLKKAKGISSEKLDKVADLVEKYNNKPQTEANQKELAGKIRKLITQENIDAIHSVRDYFYSKLNEYVNQFEEGSVKYYEALAFVTKLLQIQTNASSGISRQGAVLNSVTLDYSTTRKKPRGKGIKRYQFEHNIQLLNFNMNVLKSIIDNKFNKVYPLVSSTYSATLLDSDAQLVLDSKDGVTTKEFDSKYPGYKAAATGKTKAAPGFMIGMDSEAMFMIALGNAERTLHIPSGLMYDKLLYNKINKNATLDYLDGVAKKIDSNIKFSKSKKTVFNPANSGKIFKNSKNKSIFNSILQKSIIQEDVTQEVGELAVRIDNSEFFNKVKSEETLQSNKTIGDAINFSRSANNPTKGITVLDFDDTLATSKSLVISTSPDGVVRKLTAEEFATEGADLLDQGWTHDFSEFSKVVDGKVASLFKKAMKLQGKFGPENMFVLTARPADSAPAIFEFLKANGLNIPLKNITGLANSTSESKALWIADKVGEGYNDFYFADDALQNVQAVKNMLDQFDVKSKVQQAKVKFSKSINENFNDILENVTGIESDKRFSIIKGRKRGDSKGKFRLFIPPSHEDFVGLLYNFMGKGKEGNKHRDFFEQALVRPLNRAYREIDTAKQAIANDYKSLNKQFSEVKDKLTKTTPDGDFTFQDAIRVYLWNKHGYKIPGLTTTDQQGLVDLVVGDPQLQAYAETLNVISKQEKYVDPGQNWEAGNIRIDLVDAIGRVGRKEYFAEFNENAEIMFSEENLNKIEAAYGRDFRDALEDMLYRIGTGVNRPKGSSAKPNVFMNWLNASVSGVMFFNTRSALLQQMSNVNFLNFADNNVLAAGKAFANQPQYWKDFAMIFNSDMLKQRRGGLQTDINGAELAEAIKKARPDNMFDQVSIIVGKALKLGFLPTQIGDNIAIATGGAAFYRNRVNKNIKDGMSIKEAEEAAFTDLQNITQSTQQSARPDMTSKQQASWIGKLVLNFLNTPSQYNRIIKKAGSDILNRRITPPNTTQMQSDMSNASRILYYGAAQNLIFYGLQTALFAVMFGMENDDEEKRAEQFLKKKERVINGSIDTILRGSGIYGVAVSTLKNMIIKFIEQRDPEKYNKDESAVLMELANFSPVVGIKFRRIVNAEKTLNYNVGVMNEMETFDVDNPQWSAATNYIQTLTTAPVNKIYQKTINLRNASDNQYTAFQRALFLSGYTTWSLNLGDTEKMKEIKEKTKNKKKTNTRSRTRTRTRSRTRTR